MDETQRAFQLIFDGEDFESQAPIEVVASKLQALQKAFFHAAAAVRHDTSGRRGQWANKYRDFAELTLKAAHYSQLAIDVGLPRTSADLLQLGRDAATLLFKVAGAAARGDGQVSELIPDRQSRDFLLRGIEDLCPREEDQYSVRLVDGISGLEPVRLCGDVRDSIRRIVARREAPLEPRIATLVGQLVKIHVEVGPPMISVQLGDGQEIKCYYDNSLRDQIENLIPGSLVQVAGLASFDPEGKATQLNSVTDVELVDMAPLRMRQFQHEGTIYHLEEPLLVAVEHDDGLWVYHSAEIGLWGVGERRADALKDLRENFDFLYREYAVEDDEALDVKARALKKTLQGLVKRKD
jgi:hypothetical protein